MKAITLIAGLLLAGIALVAFGQQLAPVVTTPATGGFFETIGTMAVVALVVAIVVFAAWRWYERKHPSTAANLSTTASADWARLTGVVSDLATSLKQHAAATTAAVAATAPAPAADVKKEPVAVGKNGQPGSLTLTITGDPAKDTSAFNAAYFG